MREPTVNVARLWRGERPLDHRWSRVFYLAYNFETET